MNYFTIIIQYEESIPDGVTWYNLFADLYGMKTTCYDGYVRDIRIVDKTTLELSCYLVDDPMKLAKWKDMHGLQWRIAQDEAIKLVVRDHCDSKNKITCLVITSQ